MRDTAVVEKRKQLLRNLRRRQFERVRFMGCDALVAWVPEGKPMPAAVKARIGEGTDMRIYLAEDGYLYKWPYIDAAKAPKGFDVETGGWDHEHCNVCNRSIEVGKTAWLTARGSYFQLCAHCYSRVVQFRRTGERYKKPRSR